MECFPKKPRNLIIIINAGSKVKETIDNMLMDLTVQVTCYECHVVIKSEFLYNNYLYVSRTKLMGCYVV